MVHGSIAIIKVFFMGTAVPAMLSYYFLDNSFIYIGASGAIQALIYAHLFIMTLQWARMENKSFAVLRLVVIAFWLIQDNCWQLFRYYATADLETPISWLNLATSPFIGATYGVMVLYTLRLNDTDRHPKKVKSRTVKEWSFFAIYLLASLTFCIIGIVKNSS